MIANLKESEVLDNDDVSCSGVDCHHHLQNVWIKAMNKRLTKYLTNILAGNLSNIHYWYHVTTDIVNVITSVDKEFNFPANYPKGHENEFKF